MTLKLGLSGHHFSKLEPEEFLKIMKNNFEIEYLDYWPHNSGDLTISQYKMLLKKYDIKVYSVNIPGSEGRILDSKNPFSKELFLKYINMAIELNANFIQLYTGVLQYESYWTVVEMFVREITPLIEIAEQNGITIVMENNLDQRNEDIFELNPSRHPETIKEIVNKINSPYFRIAYDPCNFYTTGVEEYPYSFNLLEPYIVNVHLKDCMKYSPVLHDNELSAKKLLIDSKGGPFLPVPLGKGAINWQSILENITKQDNYIDWITLDPFIYEDILMEWCDLSLHFLKDIDHIRKSFINI